MRGGCNISILVVLRSVVLLEQYTTVVSQGGRRRSVSLRLVQQGTMLSAGDL